MCPEHAETAEPQAGSEVGNLGRGWVPGELERHTQVWVRGDGRF